MPSLTIKNMPEDVYQRLRESARLHRRSLNSEAIVCLDRSLGRSRRGVEETLASLRLLHERLKDLPPLDDDFLEAAKNQGRRVASGGWTESSRGLGKELWSKEGGAAAIDHERDSWK